MMLQNPLLSCLATFALNAWVVHAAPAAVPSSVPTAVLSSCAASMDGQLPATTPANFEFSGTVRRYYVAAEETEWDYAPTGWDNWLGVPLEKSPRANAAGANHYGTKWLKALYRGYTDSSFSEYTPQPAWQGTQGPTLRSEVGDLIEIMFVNKLTKNYATMHSMGLNYAKPSEGSDYANNTEPGVNVVLPTTAAVPPIEAGVSLGDCVVYKWMVSDAAGPSHGEPAKVHSYHSYVTYQQDTNAGLIGPQIVYAVGQMNSTMENYREFTLLYNIYHESESWLSGANAAIVNNASDGASGSIMYDNAGSTSNFGDMNNMDLGSGNQSVWYPQIVNLAGSGQFSSAPSFHNMNGYIFQNNPTFEMCLNDKVIWYVNSYGSASHIFHMHGNSFTYNGFPEYAISINDGVGKTLYMDAVGGGKWQVICHVGNHHSRGMVAQYQIYYEGQCPLPALGSEAAAATTSTLSSTSQTSTLSVEGSSTSTDGSSKIGETAFPRGGKGRPTAKPSGHGRGPPA